MKKLISAFIIGAMALPVYATELSIINEIEPLVLNGKDLTGNDYKSAQVINLKEGQNQFVFALDQLVVEDGRRSKLVFPTVIIRFDLASDPVALSYPVLRNAEQAKKFRNALDFSLLDSHGNPVDYQVDLLHVKGISPFNDLEAAVAKYNQAGGIAAVTAQQSVPLHHSEAQQLTGSVTTRAALEQDFLFLPLEERQAFVAWAVQHLNN